MTQAPVNFERSNHHPFRLRKIIVFSSLAIGVLGAQLWGSLDKGHFFPFDYPWLHNWVLSLAIYIVNATLLDFWIHNILGKKASTYADPEQLLESEHVNGTELDLYFETRKRIRVASLTLAGLAAWASYQFLSHGLEVFCAVYILSTLVGILLVRMNPRIKRPRLIFRDDRYMRHPYLPAPRPFWHLDYSNWYFGRGPMP